jgi:hypothetical protein
MSGFVREDPKVAFVDNVGETALRTQIAAGTVEAGTLVVNFESSTVSVVSFARLPPDLGLIGVGDVVGRTGDDLSGAQYLFVNYDSVGRFVVAAEDDAAVGVLQNIPEATAGSTAIVRTFGRSLVRLSGTLAGGVFVCPSANGRAKETSVLADDGGTLTGGMASGRLIAGGDEDDTVAVWLAAYGVIPGALG